MKENFNDCNHQWEFQKSAEGWFYPNPTFFSCWKCCETITLQEKCALEQNQSLQDSALIQERNTRIAMWGVIISSVSCLIALFVFLFWDKTLFS